MKYSTSASYVKKQQGWDKNWEWIGLDAFNQDSIQVPFVGKTTNKKEELPVWSQSKN